MDLRKFQKLVGMLLVMCVSTLAYSAPTNTALIFMDQNEYSHQDMVGGDENGVWITTGDVVSPIAVAAIGPMFSKVANCDGVGTADILVWIKPTIYYNPQMTAFYGDIEADVYSGGGTFIATYKGQAVQNGSIDIFPEKQITTTYQKAMQQVVEKMQADNNLQSKIALLPAGSSALPGGGQMQCGLLATLFPPE